MAIDQLEYFGDSLIQHGPSNDRVYLIKLDRADLPDIVPHIHTLALHHGYSKIFVKVPASAEAHFRQDGYRLEAAIPNFYNGREDGFFMARYFRAERMIDPAIKRVRKVIQTAREKASLRLPAEPCRTPRCRLATPRDCLQMSSLYRRVFASYPFPIDDPEYLRRTMADNVIYAGIWDGDTGRATDGDILVALSSAEVDKKTANAEMTDFATHPDYRGSGFAGVLLRKLEEMMREKGVKTCYTIARATSFAMNITFAVNNYAFAGTLINNTQISGSLESMNIWYKQI
jgi:putative beta-lysine N-acetyltransferase